MSELEVRLVALPAMRVLCFNGFGPRPEGLAYQKVENWLKTNAKWQDGKPRRFFGYDNPEPSPGSPNYGYDVWVTVDDSVQPGEGSRIIDFPGGRFAVARVKAGPNGEGIFETCQALAAWVENSPHKPDYCHRPCLEESLSPFDNSPDGFTLDLFEPIGE